MKPSIVFTGGGSAGHVTPNLALIEALKEEDWNLHYIGSKASIEEEKLKELQIEFYGISSGKLRRYFSWDNFIDPFRVLAGTFQAYRLLKRLKANLVFSKGGFVAFPVVVAAFLNRIPIIAHESDLSPGLANKLSFPFVNKICVTFSAAKNAFKDKKRVIVTGTPLRKSLFQGNKNQGLAISGFNNQKPCLLIMGGSLGATSLNHIIRQALPRLSQEYQIIHLCGKGKLDIGLNTYPNYYQLEYADESLPHLFAAADLIISRSGANSLYEILALGKAHILVPLPLKASRGDQIENAHYFQEQGISIIIEEENLSVESLLTKIREVMQEKESLEAKIKTLNIQPATDTIIHLIKEELQAQSSGSK